MGKLLLCIFDLDGVIVNTAQYHYIAWRNLAQKYDYSLSEKKNEELKGVSRAQSLELILQWIGIDETDEKKKSLLHDKNNEYLELIRNISPSEVLDGVVELIQSLKRADVKIALGSASKNAKIILDKLNLSHLFDYIVDGTMTSKGKPDPQVFQMSSEYLRISPENTVVFEDAPKGVDAAINGGMKTVGIGDPKDLSKANVVWTTFRDKSISDIEKLFLEASSKYLTTDPWKIIENGFHPENYLVSESLFSIGNGKMGMRGNFEEDYTGKSLIGNYVAGIYYPDKTRVGWWKNGYPEYFAKVLNTVSWIGLSIKINGQLLDLHTCKIIDYKATLDMQKGVHERAFIVQFCNGNRVFISTQRYYSIQNDEIGALTYEIKAMNFSGNIEIDSVLDFDVRNTDSNYNDNFWKNHSAEISQSQGMVKASTIKTEFEVVCRCHVEVCEKGEANITPDNINDNNRTVTHSYKYRIEDGKSITVTKIVAIVSSFFYDKSTLNEVSRAKLDDAVSLGYRSLLAQHAQAWSQKWTDHDIIIEGDDDAQQAIRYNIFMLNQTYTGKEPRLNIGPKGFTGEKYGGSTYWDTEAYCVPFYLSTAEESVVKNLLIYRYNHLDKAILNAEKLGFNSGAALYPMVTMNGEECHNEWEITFEEIHRNGAIAYAIFDYVRYTGDTKYLADYGLEVLIAITRFWTQRFNYSEDKGMFVMLGVTGPNEYENNVNNNWYTNYIARWCIQYTIEIIQQGAHTENFNKAYSESNFDLSEVEEWKKIASNIYFPTQKGKGIFLQQDGFMDKELQSVDTIPLAESPISQHWSWDRILRSCFIKQADVLQGMYFFEDQFSISALQTNFDFYEPMTVHESSLSPCIHSILACRLGRVEKAYELFLRTSRLDLDNLNNDTEDGCHITSMGGTWMAVVKGFGGLTIKENKLSLSPMLPQAWESLSFHIMYRNNRIKVTIAKNILEIDNLSKKSFSLLLYDELVTLKIGINLFESLENNLSPNNKN